MNWTQIQNLSNRGWELAAHSINVSTDMKTLSVTERSTQFTESKIAIDGNISGYDTTSWVFPGNSVNKTLQDECQLTYSICSGAGYGFGSERYVYKTSNISSSEIYRIGVKNDTAIEEFKLGVDIDYGLIGEWNLNENSGTTAYDTSGNSNNGTITGATWNNDGIDNTLTENTDYNRTGNNFTIMNSEFAWSEIITNYYYSNILNATWQDFSTNLEYLNNTQVWLWADYSCNYTSWNNWFPDIYLRGCAFNTTCDERFI